MAAAKVSFAVDHRSVQTVTTSSVSPNSFKSKVIFDEIEAELKKVSDCKGCLTEY